MQLTFNRTVPLEAAGATETTESLADLRCGQSAILHSLEVPDELAQRLMELGFFPGGFITASGCAPGGDPRIYSVDGSEIALRKETARLLKIRRSLAGI